jgi:hypothetical protein
VAAGFISKSTITELCHGAISNLVPIDRLPSPLADLWRDGFVEGATQVRTQMRREIERLEHDVNHWYVSASYSPAQIAEMRHKASFTQSNIDWATGVVA